MFQFEKQVFVRNRIKRFVARNYENATLDFIGEEMSFSPKYISRVFSRKNGETFRDFKIKSKMERAKDLLENSHLNVNEIALNLGYQSPESFMRLFKRLNKLTPTQYRSQFSKNKMDCLKKDDL